MALNISKDNRLYKLKWVRKPCLITAWLKAKVWSIPSETEGQELQCCQGLIVSSATLWAVCKEEPVNIIVTTKNCEEE